jgi:hypothetical protein
MLLCEDEDVCVALGMNSEGMCLRHPNIHIAVTKNTQKGNNIDEFLSLSVVEFRACRICQSELGT